MNTIVVGVDASPQSQDAVSFAGRLAGATGARLRLVCAYRYSSPAGGAEVPVERTVLREEAQATLTRARAALDGAADVEIQTIADPSPARALHDVARRLARLRPRRRRLVQLERADPRTRAATP